MIKKFDMVRTRPVEKKEKCKGMREKNILDLDSIHTKADVAKRECEEIGEGKGGKGNICLKLVDKTNVEGEKNDTTLQFKKKDCEYFDNLSFAANDICKTKSKKNKKYANSFCRDMKHGS